nr:immunoglobulin heavy chain junction region [Macaca mulatta]MOW86540.1 immunoglobulin heavy chain junction region [Macaca mulatta]MOW86703.1 immunoglobulin heavy chain junction region [Macaca mulatta]MOW86721.1 immunoglobulin heavy chain junction region [Macaca mulatta]MOW86774.1 immunoglobulin heavy chain junction region [Macaca mulatta]
CARWAVTKLGDDYYGLDSW